MIREIGGNLLKAQAEAYVNPVNCVGVAGAGLALAFRMQFPDNYEKYRTACTNGDLAIGRVLVDDLRLDNPRYVISFPTKDHWVKPSQYEYIELGLISLVEAVTRLQIKSIAIPTIGCGLGLLAWSKVRPMIDYQFVVLPDVDVMLVVR